MKKALTVQVLVLVLLVAGCAKRPGLTQASAPAPTGGTARSAVGPPAAPAPTPASPRRASASTARPAPRDFVSVPDLKDIHFDFDKYAIRPADAAILDGNVTWLASHPDHLVLIEGHCDERGTNEYNVALGDRRAKATLDYLVAHGVSVGRITVVSYGEQRPLCTEHGEACWSRNRRAHFLTKPQ
jgi:peptidoglycan-associated lipoprotein